jgi:hypothetical protein
VDLFVDLVGDDGDYRSCGCVDVFDGVVGKGGLLLELDSRLRGAWRRERDTLAVEDGEFEKLEPVDRADG